MSLIDSIYIDIKAMTFCSSRGHRMSLTLINLLVLSINACFQQSLICLFSEFMLVFSNQRCLFLENANLLDITCSIIKHLCIVINVMGLRLLHIGKTRG